ncbi:hypothetical protein KM043_011238 [Ampulex compressa]|nr:hypothetical protein KM043_011238 [Ampulex compressa]
MTFRLFFLEANVSKLVLTEDAYRDSGGAPLRVKISFLNFPTMEIMECNRVIEEDSFFFEFEAGQSRHFSMQPQDLFARMKKNPVSFGVFRAGDSFPICHVITPLSGCACDLGSMSIEESSPFTFKGPFDLLDPGGNFAGQLGIDVSVTNMGRFIITQYALARGYFVLKKDSKADELECRRKQSSLTNLTSRGFRKGDGVDIVKNLMKDIAGISPVSERLSFGRPPPKPPLIPLVDPQVVQEPIKRIVLEKKQKKKKRKK